jgi:hypothetical protein
MTTTTQSWQVDDTAEAVAAARCDLIDAAADMDAEDFIAEVYALDLRDRRLQCIEAGTHRLSPALPLTDPDGRLRRRWVCQACGWDEVALVAEPADLQLDPTGSG